MQVFSHIWLSSRSRIGAQSLIVKGSIRDLLAVEQLQQAQLRVIGAGADKFRIQSDGGGRACRFADSAQAIVGGDHLIVQSILFNLRP